MLPKLLELVRRYEAKPNKVNWDHLYDLMFTRRNLKLVDTVCHIKQEHELDIDDRDVLL